jgi:site-specific recombinase XerD
MLPIPKTTFTRYLAFLSSAGISGNLHPEYVKWLRFYLDFCAKYVITDLKQERLQQFLDKLREKNQGERQCSRAAHAVTLYFEMQDRNEPAQSIAEETAPFSSLENSPAGMAPASKPQRHSQHIVAGYREKSDSPEWDAVLAAMAAEIKVRHYSRKTLKTYGKWSRCFQRFLKSKSSADLNTDDVKEYLTFLAVKCNVAASTQNQAFNSLLFLFRHGLKREFGELHGVPRAKISLYIPVVLSRQEIDGILEHLSHTYDLVVKLLFGCGLRQFECLNLRVRDFNFDDGILTIHGKGKKDRTVPLPEAIVPELKAQIEKVAELHEQDLATNYDGVFLEYELQTDRA